MVEKPPAEDANKSNESLRNARGTLPRALYEFKKEFCDLLLDHVHIDDKDVANCARAVIAIEDLRIQHERGLLPRFTLGSLASRVTDTDSSTSTETA